MALAHDVLVTILTFSSVALCLPKDRSREKRSVLQLGFMLECSTDRSMWDYNGYGCYCGLGGEGTPLDATDRCCQTHDYCYDKMSRDEVCPKWWEKYTAFYRYTPCAICGNISSYDHWYFKLLLATAKCRFHACQCDSALAACVKKALPTFNPDYRHYKKKTCKHLRRWTDIFEELRDKTANTETYLKSAKTGKNSLSRGEKTLRKSGYDKADLQQSFKGEGQRERLKRGTHG